MGHTISLLSASLQKYIFLFLRHYRNRMNWNSVFMRRIICPLLSVPPRQWRLATLRDTVASPSVRVFANEENLVSLYYMRARTRGTGVGGEEWNVIMKKRRIRVCGNTVTPPHSVQFLHPHPSTLWLVAAAFEIRTLFSVARTHSGSNHTPLQSWLLLV